MQSMIEQNLISQKQKKGISQTDLKFTSLYLLKQKQRIENERKIILKRVRKNKSNEGIIKINQLISSQNLEKINIENEQSQEKPSQSQKDNQQRQQSKKKKKRSSQSILNGSSVKIDEFKELEIAQSQDSHKKYEKQTSENPLSQGIANISTQNEEIQLKNKNTNKESTDQVYQSTNINKENKEIFANKEKRENENQFISIQAKLSQFDRQINQESQQQTKQEEDIRKKFEEGYQENLVSIECSRQNSGEELEEEEEYEQTDKAINSKQSFQIPTLAYQRSSNKKEQDLYNLYNGSKSNNSFYSYFTANPKESIFSFNRGYQNNLQDDQKQDNFLDSWKQTLQNNSLFVNPFYEPNALNELRGCQDFEEEEVSQLLRESNQEMQEEEKEPEWSNVDVRECDAKKCTYKKGFFIQK